VALELRRRVAAIPGTADAHLQQELDAPAFPVDIDRSRALELGLNAQAIATDVNTSLSSSEQVTPNFWTDPANGIPHYFAVQTPEPLVSSLDELGNTPVSTQIASNGPIQVPGLLSNVATIHRDSVPTNLNEANIQPVYEVYASAQGRDLGSISGDIGKIVAELQKELKPGNRIEVLGQIQSMHDSFRDLGIGLMFAAVFVYLLMVVNYQNSAILSSSSWRCRRRCAASLRCCSSPAPRSTSPHSWARSCRSASPRPTPSSWSPSRASSSSKAGARSGPRLMQAALESALC
jgi:multidrug efflux pump subunit AcrB